MPGAAGPSAAAVRRDPRGPTAFLRAFVFGTGAAVMAVEFGAERLMEPFFGSSQLVWASLIGLVLLALAVGYEVGGRVADRWPTARTLGYVTLASGVFVGLLPLMAEPFLSRVAGGLLGTAAGTVVGSLLATVLLFMPPVAALGVASPFAIRLAAAGDETSGSRAGSLYAYSTLGSLAGTFLPAFWTIPSLGVRATFYLASALLIILGVLMARAWRLAPAVLLPALLPLFASPLLKPMPGLIGEWETPYQFAEVYRQPGGQTALSVNDAAGIQSVYTRARLTGLYYDAYLVLPFLFPRREDVSTLLVGMAAGTIPTLLQRDVVPLRSVRVTGVEIDPRLVELGRRYFHLTPEAARVVNADGRVFLETTHRRYRLMIVDAYSQEIYIPYYLTTREFFALCRSHLEPGGVVALNVNAVSGRAALLDAIERTAASVFPHVYVARAPGLYNRLIVASMRPLALPRAGALPSYLRPVERSLAATWAPAAPGPGLVLTDDRAPVETMTNQMILQELLRIL